MVRTSASGTVDCGLIPSRVKPMTLKLVCTASVLDAQHCGSSVENKPSSLLGVPLGKALNEISPFWKVRQVSGNAYASCF